MNKYVKFSPIPLDIKNNDADLAARAAYSVLAKHMMRQDELSLRITKTIAQYTALATEILSEDCKLYS